MRHARAEFWWRLMLGHPPPARRLIRLLSQREQAFFIILYAFRRAVQQVFQR